MQHALPVFERQNAMLVDALEARGVRARPLLSGVFEAKVLLLLLLLLLLLYCCMFCF
jgi:hypothetical protein